MVHNYPIINNEFRDKTYEALGHRDYRPIDFENDFSEWEEGDIEIQSGSIREEMAFSPSLDSNVTVTEFIALTTDPETGHQYSDHRLLVDCENSPYMDEVCLDRGLILVGGQDETYNINDAKDRIFRALMATANTSLRFSD